MLAEDLIVGKIYKYCRFDMDFKETIYCSYHHYDDISIKYKFKELYSFWDKEPNIIRHYFNEINDSLPSYLKLLPADLDSLEVADLTEYDKIVNSNYFFIVGHDYKHITYEPDGDFFDIKFIWFNYCEPMGNEGIIYNFGLDRNLYYCPKQKIHYNEWEYVSGKEFYAKSLELNNIFKADYSLTNEEFENIKVMSFIEKML